MSRKIALLVDADLIAYRSAAVCEQRSVIVKHLKSGKVKEFPTRTDFKQFLKDKQFEYAVEDYDFTDLQEPMPVSHALHVVKSQLETFKQRFKPEVFRVILSGKNNFRDVLPLPKKYKGNRVDSIRPLLLSDCKRYLVEQCKAEVVDNLEADDAVIFYGYEYERLGYDVIVATIDKDSKAYSGLSIWDFTHIDSEPELIGDLGYLKDTEQGVKGTGFLWYCFQMLLGDTTDYYRPFEYFGIKYGEKSIYKYLSGCETKADALSRVIAKYKELLPDGFDYIDWQGVLHSNCDYKYWLNLYHQCVRMKETRDGILDFEIYSKQIFDGDNLVRSRNTGRN